MYDLDTDGMSTAVSLEISIMLATGTMLLTPEFLRLCVCVCSRVVSSMQFPNSLTMFALVLFVFHIVHIVVSYLIKTNIRSSAMTFNTSCLCLH